MFVFVLNTDVNKESSMVHEKKKLFTRAPLGSLDIPGWVGIVPTKNTIGKNKQTKHSALSGVNSRKAFWCSVNNG